jgi:hypothetical protein
MAGGTPDSHRPGIVPFSRAHRIANAHESSPARIVRRMDLDHELRSWPAREYRRADPHIVRCAPPRVADIAMARAGCNVRASTRHYAARLGTRGHRARAKPSTFGRRRISAIYHSRHRGPRRLRGSDERQTSTEHADRQSGPVVRSPPVRTTCIEMRDRAGDRARTRRPRIPRARQGIHAT